jgi:hypothetical protein
VDRAWIAKNNQPKSSCTDIWRKLMQKLLAARFKFVSLPFTLSRSQKEVRKFAGDADRSLPEVHINVRLLQAVRLESEEGHLRSSGALQWSRDRLGSCP